MWLRCLRVSLAHWIEARTAFIAPRHRLDTSSEEAELLGYIDIAVVPGTAPVSVQR